MKWFDFKYEISSEIRGPFLWHQRLQREKYWSVDDGKRRSYDLKCISLFELMMSDY